MNTESLASELSHRRGHWVRLRTLVALRWVGIFGQCATVFVADYVLGLQFQVLLCYTLIATSVLANTLALLAFPANQRLNEPQVAASILFDILQLCGLIYLTGGLNNPFAILLLAPVAVGAASLRLPTLVGVVLFTLILITGISAFHLPLIAPNGVVLQIPLIAELGFLIALLIGIIFVSAIVRRISDESRTMFDAMMATQMALSREQKLTDIGGVVAAAAHEMGTPLATIKLVSTELVEQLEEGSHLHDDAVLIGQQTDRCRDILRSMGRAGKDDLHMRTAPMSAVVEEAAEPHIARGKTVLFEARPRYDGPALNQPVVERAPEIMHGLRNLIQNAVDFADTSVWVDTRWDNKDVTVTIADDGDGYPAHMIGRIGDPFMRNRARRSERRPEYEGMGLGLFIAKTLLERSGAELSFTNGADPFLKGSEASARKGAVVTVTWPRDQFVESEVQSTGPLGENQPLRP